MNDLPFDPDVIAERARRTAEADPTGDERPSILVQSGLRHVAATAGLDAMRKAGVPFYQRDRQLVRIVMIKAKTADGETLEVPGIMPVNLPMMARAMGQSAQWKRIVAKKKAIEETRVDPPKDVVEQALAMAGEWPFPTLSGVISTPTMRPDGTILDKAGYDAATGLVLVNPPKMPPIPARPTKADADRAIEVLQSLIAEFPFADDASRSVALSGILTVVLRGALSPAVPMHAVTAPQPGTGKSYLIDLAAAIGTGERAAVIAMSPNVEETEKRLIAAAISGQQIVVIDNVSEMMAGDFLCQITERPILRIRPLGTSTDIRIPNTFCVFANGNNLSAPADLVRRTVVCTLDANCETPETRVFNGNPVADVLADRGLYVAAALTIGAAYVHAGHPGQLPPLASFERWSGLVRSALVWLGMPDPCASMALARAEDPTRAARGAVFDAWASELTVGAKLAVPQLIQEAEEFDDRGFVRPLFREALLNVAGEKAGKELSTRRLGKWLFANKNNIASGRKLVVDMGDAKRPRWSVVAV